MICCEERSAIKFQGPIEPFFCTKITHLYMHVPYTSVIDV